MRLVANAGGSGNTMFTIGLVLSVLAIGAIVYVIFNSDTNHSNLRKNEKYTTGLGQPQGPSQSQQPNVIIINKDEAPENNPFVYEQVHNLRNPPAKPFYYPTRGKPQSYQQYGVLIGEERRHRGEQTILPLIGRQTYPGSSRYHYYTSTNGYHPMKLPVIHKTRPCNGSTGCEEIFSGNIVSVNGYDYDFKADIYPSPDLQYVL
jgi:hypothetical protein